MPIYLLQEAYVSVRYKMDFEVKLEEVEAIAERVAVLQQRVYRQCLKTLEKYLPDVPVPSPPSPEFLDVEQMKHRPLPQVELIKKRQALEAAQAQVQEIFGKWEQERLLKEEALQRAKDKDQEIKRLQALLHKKGIDPDAG